MWDYYSFNIAEHYASAIINGDYSGLSDEEEEEINEWLKSTTPKFTGHWSITDISEQEYRGCDIAGLPAWCVELRYNFKKPETKKYVSEDYLRSIVEWCNDANDYNRMPDDMGERATRYARYIMQIRNAALSGLQNAEVKK